MNLRLPSASALTAAVTAAIATIGVFGPVPVGQAIIGGHPAPIGSEPATVAIGTRGDTAEVGTFCGGTLIRANWVVTAAHCLEGATAAKLVVFVGRTVLDSDEGSAVLVSRVVRNRWNQRTDRNDIALLQLRRPVAENPMPLVRKVDLAYQRGTRAMIAGWGGTRRDGSRPADHLREGRVKMVAQWRCQEVWGSIARRTQVCAGLTTPTTVVDTCAGDSGGPLTILDSSGVRRLAGITSFGGRKCGRPSIPGVYTKVRPYHSWIARVTG